MSITNELLAHMSYSRTVEKNVVREQLEKDMAEFSGKVKVLKGVEFKPRPKRSVVESPKERYASNVQQLKIMNWCNAGNIKKPRRTSLSELSGISLNRVRACITTGRCARLMVKEYNVFIELMPVIEEMERKEGVMT